MRKTEGLITTLPLLFVLAAACGTSNGSKLSNSAKGEKQGAVKEQVKVKDAAKDAAKDVAKADEKKCTANSLKLLKWNVRVFNSENKSKIYPIAAKDIQLVTKEDKMRIDFKTGPLLKEDMFKTGITKFSFYSADPAPGKVRNNSSYSLKGGKPPVRKSEVDKAGVAIRVNQDITKGHELEITKVATGVRCLK